MLWSEFKQGTECKESDKNYSIYKSLEALYMKYDYSKEDIYKVGRLLVDNSETEAEKAYREQIEKQIETEKEDLRYYSDRIETLSLFCRLDTTTQGEAKEFKNSIKEYKQIIKRSKQRIEQCKWLLKH